MATARPPSARRPAACSPAGPAPTTTTSKTSATKAPSPADRRHRTTGRAVSAAPRALRARRPAPSTRVPARQQRVELARESPLQLVDPIAERLDVAAPGAHVPRPEPDDDRAAGGQGGFRDLFGTVRVLLAQGDLDIRLAQSLAAQG